jgi:hypothetical protein
MGVQQRAVDVDDDLIRCCPGRPRPSPRRRPSHRDAAQAVAMDRVEHTPHRRVRADRAEQVGLLAQHGDVGQAVTAIGKHHRKVSQHDPRIVRRATPPSVGHRRRQPGRQPDPVSQLGQQQ